MATAAVTNTFTNNTNADATEVNANFSDLVQFLNTEVIHKDGSVAFTALPTIPTTVPTLAAQAVSKSYLDTRVPQDTFKELSISRVAGVSIASGVETTMTFDTETADVDGFITAPSATVTVPSGCGGMYVIAAEDGGQGVAAGHTPKIYLNGLAVGWQTTGSLAYFGRAGAVAYLAVGDTIQVKVTNGSLSTDTFTVAFRMIRVAD